MKKILLILTMFALAAPTMAAISITVVDNGDCTANINYDMGGAAGDQRVRAWALTVAVDSGTIDAVSPGFAGENYGVGAGERGFGIFPGTIVIIGGVIDSNGTPVAPATDPGAGGTGIGQATAILEMGSLFVGANSPPNTGTLAVVTVSEECNMSVTVEVTYRGGVVREDSSPVSPTLTGATNVAIVCPPCVLVVDTTMGGVYITSAMITEHVTQGYPDSWCYDCHFRGDINNDCTINGTDILGFNATSGWQYSWNTAYTAGSDINNDGVINGTDILGFDATSGWQYGWGNQCGSCTP